MKKMPDYKNRVNEDLFSGDKTFRFLMSAIFDTTKQETINRSLLRFEKNIPYWNALADSAAKPNHHPYIEKYDAVGNSIERVILPLETRLLRHRVVEAGIFQNDSMAEQFCKVYLLSQIGEASLVTPLANTNSLNRLLVDKASLELRNKFLDKMHSSEYPLPVSHCFIEQMAATDVGAIQAVAQEDPDGDYLIHAEKWDCTSPNETYLVSARIAGADEGEAGVSLFLVPHQVPDADKNGKDYKVNNVNIKRLKQRVGAKSLPNAEIDFNGSKAYLIGYGSEGFSNLRDYITNSIRLHSIASALGYHRRAFVEARNYSLQRMVKGQQIINYPMVAESLVKLLSSLAGKQIVFCQLLNHVDEHGWMPENKNEMGWRNFIINMLKFRSTYKLTENVKDAMIVFGNNGTSKDFSILSRLLQDSLVQESWMGTHHTICYQIMKDIHEFDFMARLNQEIENLIQDWPNDVLVDSKKFFIHHFEIGSKLFTPKNLYDPYWAQSHAIRFVNHFSMLMELGNLVRAGVKSQNANLLILASYLSHDNLSDRFSGYFSPCLEHLTDFCQDLIRELPIDVEI
ncbi:hypothetical protein BVY03_05260 [bacterium K02(2017)]|nr:hypothetical protein BVY03_05260 [bacterium K02(2017)]